MGARDIAYAGVSSAMFRGLSAPVPNLELPMWMGWRGNKVRSHFLRKVSGMMANSTTYAGVGIGGSKSIELLTQLLGE